jgi:hypothetical protein
LSLGAKRALELDDAVLQVAVSREGRLQIIAIRGHVLNVDTGRARAM